MTFLEFKQAVRATLFPNGESSNLRIPHDKAILDAVIDLQTWVPCLASDNTTIVEQCATFYNCGLTVLDAPKGRIMKVSVINTEPAGSPAGDEIISEEFEVDLVGATVTPVSIGVVPTGGKAVIKVVGVSNECGSSAKPVAHSGSTVTFVSAGKQYFNVSIIYTDLNNQAQTVSKRVPISECNSEQFESINIKANSTVYVNIAPFNVPETTGTATITVSINSPASYVAPEEDKWCSEIEYRQTDPHYVQNYFNRAQRRCWPSLARFFDLPFADCDLIPYRATPAKDIGLAPGLPLLPLGYHYANADTDRRQRSNVGLWATERGKIFLVPWIQSTEKVVIKWDGIKRDWSDGDIIDNDPLLRQAVTEYVRADNARNWERDYDAAAAAQGAFAEARQKLWHECREETRIRGNEPSFARAGASTGLVLFYNNRQTATASCPTGTTGDPVTLTVEAGTVGSAISQADADAKALASAQEQATAQLACQQPLPVYYNQPQSYTAYCTGSGGAPNPDGTPVTVNIPSGRYTSSVSQADANSKALTAAQQQATAQLVCTFWNAEQTYTASCPNGQTGADVTKTVAAHTFSSLVSQSDANALALNNAKVQAEADLDCSGGSGGGNTFYNTAQSAFRQAFCTYSSGTPPIGQLCTSSVTVHVTAGLFSSIVSQGDANIQAIQFAASTAQQQASIRCANGQCGVFDMTV